MESVATYLNLILSLAEFHCEFNLFLLAGLLPGDELLPLLLQIPDGLFKITYHLCLCGQVITELLEFNLPSLGVSLVKFFLKRFVALL